MIGLDPLKLLREAIAAAKAGDKPLARGLLQRATQLNPRSEVAWLWLAGLVETPAEAVTCFEHVLGMNPSNENALQAIESSRLQAGIAAAQAGDNAQARSYLRAVVQQNPNSELGWLWMAGVAETSEAAMNHLERVLAINPANERALSGIEWHRSRIAPQEIGSDTEDYVSVEHALRQKDLVVDDDSSICKFVATILEKHGYQVIEAADGEEGIAHVHEHKPDLILLDINLPGMNGYQVCKAIKAKPATSDVPIIMLSDHDGFFDKVRGRMAGSTEYITKAFQPDELVQVVQKYCKKRK